LSVADGRIDTRTSAVDDRIGELVDRCVREIPFYAHHLAGRSDGPLGSLPTSSKHGMREWGQRPLAGIERHAARYCATSGTTGPRMLVGFSDADWERLAEHLARRGRAIGLGPDDLVVNTHGYGLWIGGPALDLVARGVGAGLIPLGPGQTDQLLDWLAALPVTAMSATPSYLRFLAHRIRADHVDTADWALRVGLVGGEGASTELRRETSRLLGPDFRWQELYGASEVGGPTLGWSPPGDEFGGRLLVDTDEFVVELLHPDRDEPVRRGEVGEITVTTPFREIDPLVRYRTRDLTSQLDDDPTGTPVVRTIVGRVDDAIKVRGALVHPSAIESVVVGMCPIGVEWRIVLDREPGQLDTLTVVVEHVTSEVGDLADAIRHRIAVHPIIEVVEPGSLPRFEAKASRVVDRR
jgi:phenylacetate-CoA ligase